ncbi:MAG: alpha/beta fold hydrolase [Ruminococcus sp.]|nr:alpha/beta fold hydrolase [Ruminococcus sp.]
MKKHILSLILALPLLASCSSSAAPQSDTAPTSASVTDTVSESSDWPSVPIPDLTGVTVTDPFTYEVSRPDVKGSSADFFRDGLKIHGELYLPEGDGPFPVIVISSGQTAPCSFYYDEAEAFSESGYACIVYDSVGAVGNSSSDGEITDSSVLTEVQDLNAILDSLPDLPKVDADNVFLFGHSIGGLVDIITGAHRPDDIKGMILLEPAVTYPDFVRANNPVPANLPDVINEPRMYNALVGKQFIIDMSTVDVLKETALCDKDVLMIIGTADEKTSSHPSSAALYPEAFEIIGNTFPSCETYVVDGADHLFQGEYGKAVVKKSIEYVKGH